MGTAGIDAHKAVPKLLEWLSRRLFPSVTMPVLSNSPIGTMVASPRASVRGSSAIRQSCLARAWDGRRVHSGGRSISQSGRG